MKCLNHIFVMKIEKFMPTVKAKCPMCRSKGEVELDEDNQPQLEIDADYQAKLAKIYVDEFKGIILNNGRKYRPFVNIEFAIGVR